MFAIILTSIQLMYAQEHMTFQGIPIDGSLDSMITKLEGKGFKLDKRADEYNAAIMTGIFAGKQADIYILATPKSKVVWKIAANFEKKDSWYSLKSDYKEYKEAYTTKYGKPSDSFEFFSKPYYEGDSYELQALRLDKCTYATFWELTSGTIAVKLASGSYLSLIYEDNINVTLKNKEEKNSVMDDI